MHEHSPSVSVPRLFTDRLALREYRMADFDAFDAHLADAAAMKMKRMLGHHDRRTAWRIFASNVGGWMLHGVGWWAVELRESSTLVGNAGAFYREGWPELEIGWNTFRPFRGRQIATEAAAAVLRYAFDTRGERRVITLIDAMNEPSRRVAARLGFVYEAEADFYGQPIGRYGRSAASPVNL